MAVNFPLVRLRLLQFLKQTTVFDLCNSFGIIVSGTAIFFFFSSSLHLVIKVTEFYSMNRCGLHAIEILCLINLIRSRVLRLVPPCSAV